MVNMEGYDVQIEQFKLLRPAYELFARHLKAILENVAHTHKIGAVIQVRAKTIPSFAEKIIRKGDGYTDPVNQLTDLCGARVITERRDQLDIFIDYIKNHFEIDEVNSIDVMDRLSAKEFGYLSIHYIVSFKRGIFPEVPEALYARHDAPHEADAGRHQGPKFKAEIQIRTLLQHAWAVFNHAFMYKNKMKLPLEWERNAARIAAGLEDADDDFVRLARQMQAYQSDVCGYMTSEQIRNEIQILETVQRYDPNSAELAVQIAGLSAAVNDWKKAASVLKPFEAENDPAILRNLGLSLVNTGDKDDLGHGRNVLESAIQLDSADADARCFLAESWIGSDDNRALAGFEKAFHTAPGHPEALSGYLVFKIINDKTAGFLSLVRSSLDKAVSICLKRVELGIDLPKAFYDIGRFELLRRRPYESLKYYARAIQMSDTPDLIDQEFGTISRMQTALASGTDVLQTHLEWVARFLSLARIAKRYQSGADPVEIDALVDKYIKPAANPIDSQIRPPVLIVAGACDRLLDKQMEAYTPLVNQAFKEFSGTIFSGGTRAGISELVGNLRSEKNGGIVKIGYLPYLTPPETTLHEAYTIFRTSGHDFSPAEPIQNWIDLLGVGIRPDQVKLVGINGGEISAVEYRIALALGAKVGILRDSGRAASHLYKDSDWQHIPNLAMIPSDSQSLAEFLHFDEESGMNEEIRDRMAAEVHERYRQEQKSRFYKNEPVMAKWEQLREDFKDSCRFQVDHIRRKLLAIGMDIKKAQDSKSISVFTFSEQQVETMAEMEHGRWNIERLLNGWKYGATRDPENKISPYFVAWSDLPEEVKEWDRQAVQNIPELLNTAGYEIVPANTTE